LLCLLQAISPPSVAHWLEYDRTAVLAGEVWRLWTCHMVHYSTQHMLGDVAALLLIGMLTEKIIGSWRTAGALLLGAPTISIGLLLFAPNMEHFRGASALAAMLAIASGMMLWNTRPRLRLALLFWGALLGGKVLLESFGISFTQTGLPAGVSIAWQAHFIALALGLLSGWFYSRRDLRAQNTKIPEQFIGSASGRRLLTGRASAVTEYDPAPAVSCPRHPR
jgi:rhomboid family GlyGly-CTERM serine protease